MMQAKRSNVMGAFLSPFAAWGVAFGFAVGWGAFVMPGASLLPGAGPLGTAIGVVVGAAALAVFAWNYQMLERIAGMIGEGPAGAYTPLVRGRLPRILFTDDAKFNHTVMAMHFRKLGLDDCTYAMSGPEALENPDLAPSTSSSPTSRCPA